MISSGRSVLKGFSRTNVPIPMYLGSYSLRFVFFNFLSSSSSLKEEKDILCCFVQSDNALIHVLSVSWIKHISIFIWTVMFFSCLPAPSSLSAWLLVPRWSDRWEQRRQSSAVLPAIPESVPRACSHPMHVSNPSPLLRTAAAAAADCVSSANNAHACDSEWVEPDSSSWNERKIEPDRVIGQE